MLGSACHKCSTQSEASVADEVAAEVEFLSLVEGTLLDGNVVIMSVLQEAYIAILSANNVVNPKCSRKKLKQLMQTEIPNIEFHRPKRVNEAERISIKSTRDAAIQLVEETSVNSDMDMKVLYNAASVLRKAISKAKKWTFGGSLTDVTDEHLPKELYCFYRWVIQGSHTTLSTDKKSSQVNKHAVNLAHTTVTMFVSEQQVRNKKSLSLRSTREMPQQLAVGIAIRQATRSKKLISILHGFGMSVEYNRLLRVEGQLATSVLQRMLVNDNIYLPPDVVLGRHVFFAVDNVDNVDFAEDTPDGKRTLHATAMAIYQRCQPEDEVAKLQLTDAALRRSMKDLPGTVTTLLDCPKPTVKPPSPVYASFSLKDVQPPSDVCLPDVAWLMGRTLVRSQKNGSQMPVMEDDDVVQDDEAVSPNGNIPTWSAYHSLIADGLPLTRVGTPPLIAAPAHEWQTLLLTVLMQAQGINTKVMGPDRKTVISLDMGLYKPEKQLQMSRKDMDHMILRPGELHIVMAELYCIGAYIENSGIDFCWTEADLYGPTTVKQIIEGKHVKRGVEAHMITLQALFTLYQEAFFQEHPDLLGRLTNAAVQLDHSCRDGSCEEIQQAHLEMVQTIESLSVMEEMTHFDSQKEGQPLSVAMRQYMQMVMEMVLFIRSVRTGDWNLHLTALEAFTTHFFNNNNNNNIWTYIVHVSTN